MDEVRLAVEKGYRILEIYDVYEYQVNQYSPETGKGGHFVDYINTFLKLKAEVSGYPGWVRSPADEDLNIETFFKNEGIGTDRECFKSNVAKRGLAKLCLNSMWRKLTERNDRTQTKVISEPKDLYSLLATPGIEVTNLSFASDDVVWISWKHAAEEHVQNLRHTKEVIGAYVTAGARIHLYRYLDRLGERAIYCDTDSVIYIQPKDEHNLIETGDKLGKMTSELRPTDYVFDFVSRRPKNYEYTVIDTVTGRAATDCKVRGITLNFNANQLVNFDVIKAMILGKGEPTVTVHTEKKIKRKRNGGGTMAIVTEPEDNMYRI